MAKPEIGKTIKYVDEVGTTHDALITAVWSDTCVNLVYVNQQEGQKDDYGQKIVRKTSVVDKSRQDAPGFYWYL